MSPDDARAMVAQLFWYASAAKQDVIARLMLQEQTNAMHAAWLAYGRPRGFPCACTPCLAEPPIGSEIVVRLLVSATGLSTTETTP